MVDWANKAARRQEQRRTEWISILGRAFKNIPRSAWAFGSDIAQALIHPVETAKTIGGIGMGAIEKAAPGMTSMLPGKQYDRPYTEQFDQMIDFFIDRYGSVENFKNTVAEDPVGVTADVASIMTGGGGTLRGIGAGAAKASKLSRMAKPVEMVGRGLQKAGQAIQPIGVAKQAFKAIPTERLYESAAKWSTVAAKPGETGMAVRKRLTRTALEQSIMPTYKGLQKLQDKLDKLDDEISKLIQRKGMGGKTVSSDKLLKHFDELERRIWNYSGEPVKNVGQVRNIKKQFIKAHGIYDEKGKLTGFKTLTPEQIQRKKVTIYRELDNYYNKVLMQPAKVDAQKAIARAAKETMEEIVPEIKQLNQSYGPLRELETAVERAAARINNRDILGIGVPIKGGAGYAATQSTGGAIAGLTWGLLDTPRVKAKIAILINRMQKKGITVTPTETAIELGLFQAGRQVQVEE